jgi:sigma-B regulation protein RsbU (phosphoserine phosphatase)
MSFEHDERHLEALLESAQLLQSALDVDDLLRHLLRSVMGRFMVGRGFVAVESDGELRIAHVRGASELVIGSPFDTATVERAGIAIVLPIGAESSPIGYLGIGRPPAGEVNDSDRQFLSALLGIAASGITTAKAHAETRRLNESLEHRVHELRTLLDIGRGFTSALDPEQVASLLALTFAGQWTLRRYAIVTWKEGHAPVVKRKGVEVPPVEQLREVLAGTTEPLLTSELQSPGMREQLQRQDVAAIVPIISGETPIGVVLAGARPRSVAYSDTDLEFAAGLAAQAAVAFENAWHFQATLEKEKLEKELQLAADIQRRLLPASMPSLAGIDVVARTRPARHVGGDYYDVVPFGSEHVFCVADVSGKGIAASLLMSNFQATLRALASSGRSLPEIVALMNDLMWASTAANKYVTAIFVAIDPATGRAHYVNAGHNDGFVLRAGGTVEPLKATGMSVGLMPSRPYTEKEIELASGDLVALYSDGVTEANDPQENEFESERLIDVLRANQLTNAETIVSAVYEAVDAFASTAPQYDDITLMVIRRT